LSLTSVRRTSAQPHKPCNLLDEVVRRNYASNNRGACHPTTTVYRDHLPKVVEITYTPDPSIFGDKTASQVSQSTISATLVLERGTAATKSPGATLIGCNFLSSPLLHLPQSQLYMCIFATRTTRTRTELGYMNEECINSLDQLNHGGTSKAVGQADTAL
jgi:hypothetical protein